MSPSILLAALALFATSALADAEHGKGHDQPGAERTHPAHEERAHDDGVRLNVFFSFTNRERIFLNDYFRRNLPPGLAKQGKLPPGHAKRLARGMPWPPGVPYSPLPEHIERQLQPLPKGYARFIAGTDVVIVDLGARLIVDAFSLDL